MVPETTSETPAETNAWVDWVETSTVYAHFPLRAALVAVFFFHGFNKLFSVGIADFSTMMGLPIFLGGLVALGEVYIGGAILYGMFERLPGADVATRSAGLLTMVIMVGAIGVMHWDNGFHFMDNGWAFQMTLALIGLFFALRGNRI